MAPFPLEQEGALLPFLEKYKLLSSFSLYLRLFLMCHVCVMRLESDFLHGANCFFFPNPSTSGQAGAIWFKRVGWDAGETETV